MSWLLSPAAGTITLGSLNDVTISSISTDELIQWNGSAFINRTIAESKVQTPWVSNIAAAGFDVTGAGHVSGVKGTFTQTAAGTSNGINLVSTGPSLWFSETDATATNQGWKIWATGGDWQFYTTTDGGGASDKIIEVQRTGTTVDRIEFGAPLMILQTSAAAADLTNYGQIYVKNTNPQELWWRNDGGTEAQLATGGGGGATEIAKIKTSDTTYSSDNTFTDDGQLAGYAMTANTRYRIDGYIEVTSNSAADIKLRLQFSNGAQDGHICLVGPGTTGTVRGDHVSGAASTLVPSIDTTDTGFRISGFVHTNATTGGTIDLQHAQNTSNGVTTGLRAGSWLRFVEIT